jgi:hypothetical protein
MKRMDAPTIEFSSPVVEKGDEQPLLNIPA